MKFSWRRVVHYSEERLHEFNSKYKMKFLSATSQRACEKYIIHKLLTNTGVTIVFTDLYNGFVFWNIGRTKGAPSARAILEK